jgi:transforming growth factor-beta-induced protein
MQNKIVIGIVLTFFTIALGVLVFRNEPLMVPPTTEQSVAENLIEQGDHNRMVQLLGEANAIQDLEEGGPYTVFVPTDEAFAKLPKETLTMFEDPNNINDTVRTEDNHVILGNYPASSFYNGMKLTTVNAEILTLTLKDNDWYINDKVKIVGRDLESNNGVIHSIDTVLMPKGL